jgi:hypothetical protein
MHPDIEKLIELALSDGLITDKEREIILRKAEKLGLDIDEVDMFLESKISKSKETFTKEAFLQISSKEINSGFVPKVVQHLNPAKLDRESVFEEEIQKLNMRKKILDEKELQLSEILNQQKIELRDLNIRLIKEIEVLEKELLKKTDDFFKVFFERVNPRLKKQFSLGLTPDNANLKSIIAQGKILSELPDLKDNAGYWINYKSRKILFLSRFLIIGVVVGLIIILLYDRFEVWGLMTLLLISLFLFSNRDNTVSSIIKRSNRDIQLVFEEVYDFLKEKLDEINSINNYIDKYSKISKEISKIS